MHDANTWKKRALFRGRDEPAPGRDEIDRSSHDPSRESPLRPNKSTHRSLAILELPEIVAAVITYVVAPAAIAACSRLN
jgi:hypothetical protein